MIEEKDVVLCRSIVSYRGGCYISNHREGRPRQSIQRRQAARRPERIFFQFSFRNVHIPYPGGIYLDFLARAGFVCFYSPAILRTIPHRLIGIFCVISIWPRRLIQHSAERNGCRHVETGRTRVIYTLSHIPSFVVIFISLGIIICLLRCGIPCIIHGASDLDIIHDFGLHIRFLNICFVMPMYPIIIPFP